MAELTPDDVRFLDAVAQCGGRDVTTTQIRRATGFGDEKTRYRHTKLEGSGYIIGARAGPKQNDPRTATLTDRGRRTVDSIDLDTEPDPPESFNEIQERLSEVETRLQLRAGPGAPADSGCRCGTRLHRLERIFTELRREVQWHEKVVEATWIAGYEDITLSETLDGC